MTKEDVYGLYNPELKLWYGIENGGDDAGHGWGPLERASRWKETECVADSEKHLDSMFVRLEVASKPTIVTIPGEVTAHYRDGIIERIYFTPHGSGAGHFGAIANVWDGPEIDVENTDGPFWKAVQHALANPDDVPDDSLHLCLSWYE